MYWTLVESMGKQACRNMSITHTPNALRPYNYFLYTIPSTVKTLTEYIKLFLTFLFSIKNLRNAKYKKYMIIYTSFYIKPL